MLFWMVEAKDWPKSQKELFLGAKNKYRIAVRPGAMRSIRYPIYASFPTTVLTVSGSRVRTTESTLSRMHPAPRRLMCLRWFYYTPDHRFVKKQLPINCSLAASRRGQFVTYCVEPPTSFGPLDQICGSNCSLKRRIPYAIVGRGHDPAAM